MKKLITLAFGVAVLVFACKLASAAFAATALIGAR
jgi:hypothetical protein